MHKEKVEKVEIKNFIGNKSLINEMWTCRSCWNTSNSIKWFASIKTRVTVYTCPVCKSEHTENV